MNNTIFLDNIEKVYKVASEKINKQLEEDVQEIIDRLHDYFIQIIDLKDSKPDKFRNLLVRPRYLNQKNPQNIPLSITEFDNPSLEGIQIYCNIFFKIWKKSTDNELDNTAHYTLTIIEKILNDLLKRGKDYLTISHYFIRLIQNINLAVNTESRIFNYSSVRAAYGWYFDIVFSKTFKIENIFNLQISLFNSINISITNNNKRLFASFIDHIINGMWTPVSNLLSDIDFRDKMTSENKSLFPKYSKAKQELESAALTAYSYKDYQIVIEKYNLYKTVLFEYNIPKKLKEDLADVNLQHIVVQFKYNILKQTVIWLGSYCLFKERYDFIDTLLFFNQPKDSSVSWVNQDINPLHIGDIIDLYHRGRELDSNITFLWDGHHEFLTYYNLYLAILFINAIRQNSRKGKNWMSEFNLDFKGLNKNVQEIESYTYTFEGIISQINKIKGNKNLLIGCGLNIEMADNAIKLLDNLKANVDNKKNELIQNDEIDPDKVKSFINGFIDCYKKGSSIRNIINYYNPVSNELLNDPDDTIPTYGINEITMKSFFGKNDAGSYFGWPEAYARHIIFHENHRIKNQYISKCDVKENIDLSLIGDKLDKIEDLANKIIIFSNIYPSYEIFESNSKFKPIEELKNSPNIPNVYEFVGRYMDSDVFTYYDETKWKQLLIIDKNKVGKLNYYYPKEKNKNIIEQFQIEIFDLNKNESAEKEIREKIIQDQPYWLLEKESDKEKQEQFIKTQANLIVRYKMNLELPDDFIGWFYPIK